MSINVPLLRESFEAIKPVAMEVVNRFYATLFESHPEASGLFKEERMEAQKKALVQSLVAIFDKLERPEELRGYLENLGARHGRYGVQPIHYDWVAEALLSTLKYYFGETWTEELEGSWMAALGLIAETMRAAQARAVARPSSELADSFRDEITRVVRDVMSDVLADVIDMPEIREKAAQHAKTLLTGALREQMDSLKEHKQKEKAA